MVIIEPAVPWKIKMVARSARSQAPVILDEILLNIIGMIYGLHDLSIQQSTALKSFVSGSDDVRLSSYRTRQILNLSTGDSVNEIQAVRWTFDLRSFAPDVIVKGSVWNAVSWRTSNWAWVRNCILATCSACSMKVLLDSCRVFLENAKIEQAKERLC